MCLVPINDLGLMPLGGAEALLALYLVQPNQAAGEGGGIEGRSWQWDLDARVLFWRSELNSLLYAFVSPSVRHDS